MPMATTIETGPSSVDRAAALKEFDETKAGVKGLVDSGITSIPSIFHHPNLHITSTTSHLSIPTIDFSLPRPIVVDLIRSASINWGFFQLINHGIPLSTIQTTISTFRSFNELPTNVRCKHYKRGMEGGFSYSSNVDLYKSVAASWRDTIQIMTGPARPDLNLIPEVCRMELVAWDERAKEVARELMGMMCEGLGVGVGRMEEMTCLEGRLMACHYYPPCPEPDQTMGTAVHTDPCALTLLVEDQVGGLQVKQEGEDGEEFWVDVKPVPGALVINVGDLLQIMSNDTYKSVEHRVRANSEQDARVSIAIFYNPGKRGELDLYGPLPELISSEKPAVYRNFTMREFMGTFFGKELRSKSLVECFKL
ncbi:1-aminocyclopropane-1-carboxylate oxidase homolog 3-like [Dioscorea cayenensis subsp. rotundata]|uniref:1-aminocyclopropane-1-carboxylate oxidase homolog 3-like n=1 Tax=Dioscorea cayennensis subsp. rotundata TaxID=55577 RepID=A0AB40CYB6_DIOCR|nr:1-aminocyclopropane-1-carboxylate oxidase homolog 3-like [Dioscorea cayenensis subsp. rotundata]